ncbi:MAG: LPS translocon maturation chaperone LptM [Rhizobiaceae bacterium]
MAQSLSKLLINMALVLMMALVAVSCGRRGNLEAPPDSTVISVDENGEELPPPEKEDKPFILDPLL